MDMPLLRGRSRHFPFLRILADFVLRRRFAFRSGYMLSAKKVAPRFEGRMAECHPPSRSTFTIRKFYYGHCSDDSSAMSIDVALSTHYGARRNTPLYYGRCGDDSSAMSIDVALSTHYGSRRNTPLYYGRCGSAATRTEWHVNGHATTTRPLSPFSFFTDFAGFCPPAPICISLRFVVYL